MANYTSQPITLAPVTTSINLPLIQQVLQVKQGTYNQADAQVQAGLSSLENLKLLRPQDTEYLNSKIKGMTASLDNMQDKDLSNPNVASNFYSTIKSVARDPFVVEAASNTVKYQQFQAQMQDIQKKNPDKFHQINYQFALDKAGLNQYMDGTTNSLGSFSYHNYSDYNKNLLERMKTLKDVRGDREVQIQGNGLNGYPEGTLITKKLSGLTPQEIVDYVPGMMTSEDDMQMRIEGWWTGKQNPQQLDSEFLQYTENKKEQLDSSINLLETKVNNKQNTEEEREIARQQLRAFRAEKENFLKNVATATLEEKGYFVKKNDYVKALATSAGASESVSISEDKAYYARQNLQLKTEELDIKRAELLLKQQKAGTASGAYGMDGISESPLTAETAPDIDPIEQVTENFKLTQGQLTENILDVYSSNTTASEIKDQYSASMNAMGYTPEGNLLNANKQPTIDKATAMAKAFEESKMYLSNPDKAAEIVRLKTLADNSALDYNNTVGSASKELFNSAPQKYITEFVEKIKALEMEDDGFITGLFGVGGGSERVQNLTAEARKFINEVGGEKNLKSIGSNSARLEKFRDLYGKLSQEKEYNLNFRLGNMTFARDVEAKAGELLKSTGVMTSFGSANQATLSNESQNQRLIAMIPTTEESRPFDPKKKITVYQKIVDGSPSFVVEQNVGFNEKMGEIKKATAVLTPKMAGYEFLRQSLDMNESSRGLSAEVSKEKISIAKNPAYIKDDGKYAPKIADYLLKNTPPSYIGKALFANPANYLTKTNTEEAYSNVLRNNFTPEQIQQVTEHISSRLSQYKIDLEPLDGEWYMSLEDKETGADYRGGKLGQKNLETQFLNIAQNYPHTIVLDFFLRDLATNNKNAFNRIMNNGR